MKLIKNLFTAKRILKAIFLGATLFVTSTVFASGLTIPFGSGIPSLGSSRAGDAAIAEDASSNINNPAGLIRIHEDQVIISASGTNDHKKFTGTMTNPGLAATSGFPSPITETGTNSSDVTALVPNIHYVHPVNEVLALGLSLLVPYGLGLNYPNDSITRYEIMNGHQKGFEISPSIAFSVTPQLSFGVGPDMLYYAAQFKSAQRTQPLTATDIIATNEASSYNNYGWHAGVLYQFNPCTRIGLSYRSQIITHLDGTSRLYVENSVLPPPFGLPNGMITSNNLKIVIPLASLTTLSAYRDVTSRWAVMATLQREGWSNYRNDRAYNVATPAGPANVVIPAGYHDTWFASVGSNYQLTPRWLIRGGLDYYQGFTDFAHRQVLITDPDIYGISIGARFKQSRCIVWDFGLSKGFFKSVSLNHTNPATGDNLNGTSHENAITGGAQLTWNIT